MSKIRLADYHYRKAAQIHPQNAVLLGCVGMVSRVTRANDDGKVRSLLPFLTPYSGCRADRGSGKGAGPFQRGSSNLAGQRTCALSSGEDSDLIKEIHGKQEFPSGECGSTVTDEVPALLYRTCHTRCDGQVAAEDLEILRDTSPEESNVIFQLAKVYRLIGDSVKMAQMLAVARDVSPKSVSKIRKLLETVKDTEAMDEG